MLGLKLLHKTKAQKWLPKSQYRVLKKEMRMTIRMTISKLAKVMMTTNRV